MKRRLSASTGPRNQRESCLKKIASPEFTKFINWDALWKWYREILRRQNIRMRKRKAKPKRKH